MKKILIMMLMSQLLLFCYSFYEYYNNDPQLACVVEGLCLTYTIAVLFVLIKEKKIDDAESN